jgi:NCAIR mutase (PurE)-related protein
LLEDVNRGELSVEQALVRLKDFPYEDLGFARLDSHRTLRKGFPEVVFCPGKTVEQIVGIVERIRAREGRVLAARATSEVAGAVREAFPDAVYHGAARMLVLGGAATPSGRGTVLVVSAGTADIPVADEAAVTAETLGSQVERLYDVGVAGIHRLFDNREQLFAANVLVVAAGMEGALASVVAGLVDRPVVAVPTSVGYGASFGGLSALLTMLNSCAPGVSVVNIDNGFGAGYVAHLINQ